MQDEQQRQSDGLTPFTTSTLASAPIVTAPDGSAVRLLAGLAGGGMAQFRLEAGQVAAAVIHRTVEEIWFVTEGRGAIWRRQGDREEVTALQAGLCLTIPVGTAFQFRAAADEGVSIVAVTMPPWPGADEAVPVAGVWVATC
jgi:mannose-6-phosphate isomerase-like protein (cupin superfamily)